MIYNQQQQGFNMNPGGVPHNNTPAYPNAPVGETMQPYLAVMSAKLYNDMAVRNTQYTNVMAQEYSRNGYINNLFEDALVILANYVEYMMSTGNRQFGEVIDTAATDCNSAVLENQHRSNQKLNQIRLSDDEKIRYRSAKSKMDSLRMKISAFLSSKGQNMNQPYPQNQQQGFQQPQQPQQFNNNQGFQQPQPNQQQMSPQQWQAYQQQMQQAAMYNQQQQNFQQPNQQYPNQQQMSPQQWQAYQQQMYNQQLQSQGRGNNFINRVQQRMQQPPQFNNSPFNNQQPQFNGNQQFNQGFNPQPTQHQGYQQQQNFQQPNQQYPNQHGGFAVNSNQQQNYQQPQRSTSIYQSTYDPMPTVDESKLNSNSNNTVKSDPFAHNAQFMKDRNQTINQGYIDDSQPQANSNKSFTPGAHSSQPTESNPSTSDIQRYAQRVRQAAEKLNLPSDGATISYLEAAITQLDPNNGFISSKNAYSEFKGYSNLDDTPTGVYDGKQNLDDVEGVNFHNGENFGLASDSFAETMQQQLLKGNEFRDKMAAQSNKQLVKQPNGGYALAHNDVIDEFKNNNPDIPIESYDFDRAKTNPPYEFAVADMYDGWIVDAEHFSKLNKDGWGHVEAIHPVYSTTGHYNVDNNGKITGFFSRPFTFNVTNKDIDMDYAQHDDSRFFVPLTPMDKDSVPDEAAMLAAFSNLQVQQKVSDIIKDIENESGVIDGDAGKLVITESIVLEDQINGSVAGDDYYGMAHAVLQDTLGNIDYSYTDISVRYRHVTMYPWLTSEADKDVLRKLRYKKDYLDIAEVLINMSKYATIPQSWFTLLNDVATKYVNHIVATRYALSDKDLFHIDSFCLDIKDVIIEMTKLGHGDDFIDTAKRLSDSILYVWDTSNPVFEDFITKNGELTDDDETITAGCGIVRDVTAIALHSRDVPLHASKNVCILTQGGFEDLWRVAKDRIENRDNRTSEIVIVTSDNRPMYINETLNPDIFAITKKSLFN